MASSSTRLWLAHQGDREYCEGENAFFGSEDRNKKCFLRGEWSNSPAGGSAKPKFLARTTPDLPISL
jgi:hypothetical protein